MSEPEKAIDSINKHQQLSGDELRGVGSIGYIYAKTGNVDKALECLNKLKENNEREMDLTLDMEYVALYTALGDLDEAFNYVERSLSNKLGILVYNTHPFTAELRKDKRFDELVKKYQENNL